MVGDAVFHRVVQFAHRDREMGSELVALFRSPRVIDERRDEDPVELERAYETTIGAGERVGRSAAFSASLVAVCESAAP
jgi:hypothetical protein